MVLIISIVIFIFCMWLLRATANLMTVLQLRRKGMPKEKGEIFHSLVDMSPVEPAHKAPLDLSQPQSPLSLMTGGFLP